MISFRRPRIEEIPDFAKVHVQCWQEAYRGLMPDELLQNLSTEKREEGWHSRLKDAEVFVSGVFDNARPIGFLHSGPAGEPLQKHADGQIYGIYLLEEFYRQGIGRKLIREAAIDWMARGNTMCVESLAGNIRASRFYKSLGGKELPGNNFKIADLELPQALHVFDDIERLITA